jgi:ElaB/YqjD/DUF883 family membrane-anchored ribosome-binding protein
MADGFLSGLARRVGDWRDEAEDRAEPYARRARRGGKDAMGELRGLWDRIEDLVERQVAPAASDYARSARDTAADYAGSAGDKAYRYAQGAGRYARRAARDYGPQAREAAENAAGYLRDVTRQRPLLAIGVAIAGTWLVATLLSGSRRR